MAKDKKPIDWAGIERDYTKTDLSIREMARWYGITDTAIRLRAKQGGWQRSARAKKGMPSVSEAAPAPIVIHREPTALTAETMDPAQIVGRGRNLTLRLLDELDATTAHLGEIEAAIVDETVKDRDSKRRNAMLSAVSLKARADTLKALALAAKTLSEAAIAAPEGKKAQRQAGADKAASQGRFAVPQPPRAGLN